MTPTQIPPGGMGNGLERAYSKIIFITIGYNIRNLILFLFILIYNEIKSLQSAKIKDFNQKGDPWGDLDAPEATFEQQLHLSSVKPDKNQQEY